MLTRENREVFAAAFMIDQASGAADWMREQAVEEAEMSGCALDDIVQTHEIYADFVKSHGEPAKSWTRDGRQMHVWRKVQFRKGQARGDLYLMEFDGVSGSLYRGG